MDVRTTSFILLSGLMLFAAGCGTQPDSESPAPANTSTTAVSEDSESPDAQSPAADEDTPQEPAETSSRLEVEPVYSVAEYIAERDPAKDLQATIAQASQGGKRIILEVGGNW